MGQEVERVLTNSGAPSLPPAKSITFGATNVIDLTGIPEDQINELKRQHAMGLIDLKKKADDLKIDVGALSMSLGVFNDEAAKATQSNVSMTLTHTQTSSLGRTEVVIGNTPRAAAGKLSASATGATDKTLWVVGMLAVVAVIVALIITRH